MSLSEDMNNPLESLKVEQALRSEQMKLEYRKKNKPNEINILDYTVIAALEKQIPKKPKIMETPLKGEKFWWYCGHCGASRHTGSKSNHCSFCGGKVDWSVEE